MGRHEWKFDSPNALNTVGIEHCITADDWNLLNSRLRDQELIEWIFMMKRQTGEGCQVIIRRDEPIEIAPEHLLGKETEISPPDIQLLQTDFNCNFPGRCRTHKLPICWIRDHRHGGLA